MKTKRKIIFIIVIILAIMLVALLFGLIDHKEGTNNMESAGIEKSSTEKISSEADVKESFVNNNETQKMEEVLAETNKENIKEDNKGTQVTQEETKPSESKQESQISSEVVETEKSETVEKVVEVEKESVPTVPYENEVVQQVTVEYEKWLASALVLGVSVEYPDFELVDICTETCKELTDSHSSKGVYILFKSDGTDMAVYGVPLEQERTASGTIDIGTMNMGLATFDVVDINQISKAECISYTMEDLEDTISQTMQLSLYYH